MNRVLIIVAVLAGFFSSTANVQSLVKVLDNAEYRLLNSAQDMAAKALGDFGKDSAVAVPALVRMLERNDGYNDFVAAATLGRLRRTAAPARAALLRAVQTHHNYVAAWALTQLDREDVPPARPK